MSKRLRKRLVRYGLVFGNLAIVAVAIFVVINNSGGNAADYNTFNSIEEGRSTSPLDVVTSGDIATEVASMVNLPEIQIISNDAERAEANLASATSLDHSNTVLMPQVISANLKTKADIVKYKVKKGDTVSKLAKQFGVTSNSIRWSNGLSGDSLTVGKTLYIPPVNGIVYKVKKGDTPKTLATKYSASASTITRFNDAELAGLKVNERIVIPNGEIEVVRAVSTGFTGRRLYFSKNITYLGRYTDYSPYPIGGYGRGYCTDWASHRAAQLGNRVGNWGNAIAWAGNARRDGRTVSSVPRVGAVLQTGAGGGGLGHVGVVEKVKNEGGRWYIKYSDMNGLAGWGNAAITNDWIPAAGYNYIY